MRYATVRVWTALATALLTAAVADGATEFVENLGWLGGSVRDGQHEAVVPTLMAGIAIGLALALFVMFARIGPRDPLLRRLNVPATRIVDISIALVGSTCITVAMEGYETHFGGLSPFDPRSIVLSHTPALLAAFVVVAAIVYRLLRSGLRLAGHIGQFATDALDAFLEKALRACVPSATARTSLALRTLHLPTATGDGACGMRAPPRHDLVLSLSY